MNLTTAPIRTYDCTTCQRTYKTRNGLRNHVTKVHANREPTPAAAAADPETRVLTEAAADVPPNSDSPMQRLDSAIAQMHGIPAEDPEEHPGEDPAEDPEEDLDEEDDEQDPDAQDSTLNGIDGINTTPYMLGLSLFKKTADSTVIFMIHTRELYVLAVVAGVFVANFSFLALMLMKNDRCAANRWLPLPGNHTEKMFEVTRHK